MDQVFSRRATMKAIWTALLAMAWVGLSASHVAAVGRTIIYIECKEGVSGPVRRGTGVIVSPDGHVLTAGHVVLPPGKDIKDVKDLTCRGSIGVAQQSTMRDMVVQPINTAVDAKLLRFVEPQPYEYVPYCKLENWMIRRKIFVAGFPGGAGVGVASFREGVLSTVFPDHRGLIQTDGQTIAGMSGGPVFSKNLGGLVGIVIGADFAADGTVSYFAILPISSSIASTFELIPSPVPCYRQNREVDLPKTLAEWNSDKSTVRLGVRAEEGVCFLSKVWGQFDSSEDSVSVELHDGEYVLTGVNRAGGVHGGSARCIWHE
jgi:hypothetical protein